MSTALIVGAASSLTEVLTALGRAFERANPSCVVRFSFASSGTLLQQVRQGAPLDLFISASLQELDTLEREKRLVPTTRRIVAGNRLVLIAPQQSRLKSWEELAKPDVRRVALSQPDSVPSGRYAKETLTQRGLWSTVMPKAVFGQNVRQTLAYVAAGDVDAGIVFATDAQREKRVRVVATAVPGKDHTPIVYPAAVIAGSAQAELAQRFIAFLLTPEAQAAFRRAGFVKDGTI